MYSFYETTRSKDCGRTSTNMYLQYKWDVENFANHRFNVKTAKPRIDNSAPSTFTHMFIRPKKLQYELERYSTIQRNNRFLMERLATIQREGAWIDNKNYHGIKSLNIWKRQQEMIYLAYNNQIMLGRLLDVNAGLNKNRLEDEYLMNQKYKANIQKYPPNWREIQQHMSRLKEHTFKKVFDLKYQRKAYQKARKKAVERWANEKERHAAVKAEKAAIEAVEIEKKEELAKEKKEKAAKERKKIKEERVRFSEKRQMERKERLKLAYNEKMGEEEKAKREKAIREENEARRRQKKKEKVDVWKREKSEEQKKKDEAVKKEKEKERQEANKKIKARMAERRKIRKDQGLYLKDKSEDRKDDERGTEGKDGELSIEKSSKELEEGEDHRNADDDVPVDISAKRIEPKKAELEHLEVDKESDGSKSEEASSTTFRGKEYSDKKEVLENAEDSSDDDSSTSSIPEETENRNTEDEN